MKVRISTRAVYHKIAEVEIEIPNMNPNEVDEYLNDNENIYIDAIDDKLSEAEYEFGFGTDANFNEADQESEWRYDIKGMNYGGHL
jgi:hypothetical protein